MKDYHGIELEFIKAQMAELCSFSLGKERIFNLRPTFHPTRLRRENSYIKEALACTIRYGSMPFYGIKDTTVILESSKKGRQLSGHDCVQVMKLIQGTIGVVNYMKQVEEETENLDDLVSSLVVHHSVKKQLEQCFDEDGTILDTASDELYGIRKSLSKIEIEIQKVTSQFLQKNKEYLVEQILATRNDRKVVLVKVSDKHRFGGFIHGESASGQTIYVEPASFVEVNNRKQSYLAQEKEAMERILMECSFLIKDISSELLDNLLTLSILDALFAKALWGKRENAVVAQLRDDQQVYLEKARHPLIDQKQVVLNSYRIENPNKVLLITGPNTGGKTVSLKCIGLSVLMTYCGMPVCCEKAAIPIFDNVYIDIGDDQSVVQSLSTFSAHLSKLAKILNQATEKSLVLLDELGSGTDPKEGESLAIAILDELRRRKAIVVATTHYGKLKTYGKKYSEILLSSVQFDLEQMKPTYQYVEGLTGQSNAFEIARRFGLKEEVVSAAEQLKNQQKTEEDKLIEQLETQIVLNNQLKQELSNKINEKEKEKEKLRELQRNLVNEKKDYQLHIQEEKRKILLNAQEEAERIIEEMRDKRNDLKYHELLNIKQELNILEEEEKLNNEGDQDFEVGEYVELINSSQIAQIKSIDKSRITIELNGKTVHTKNNNLRKTDKKIEKKKSKFSVRTTKILEFKSECNIIGQRVDDGIEEISKFIDDAKFYKYSQVRIVHGDGSGVLRKAVHEWLRKNKSIDSFRLGMPNEGSTGVTVVTLRGE